MIVLALDVGDVRIGIARSDALGITAQPVGVLVRTTVDADIRHILDTARECQAGRILVGLPLRMDGTDSPQTQKVRAFADALARAAPVPIELADERLTSEEAESILTQAGVRGKKRRKARKRVVDIMAAQILLQDWLAEHPGSAQ